MVPVTSHPAAVTVFSNNARITRRAEVDLAAGESAIRFTGLPMSLQTDSVRVKGLGNARLLSVDVVSDYFADTPEASTAALEKQLEELLAQLRAVDDADQAQTNRLETAKTLAAAGAAEIAKGIAFGRAGIDQAQALRAYVTAEQEDAAARKRALAAERTSLNKEIEAVRAQLNRLRQPVRVERRGIVVKLQVAEASKGVMEVSYLVSDASWSPVYDLRLSGEKVAVTYLAAVTQRTGEEWKDVELSLSTAQPASSKRIPELAPWYVNQHVPLPPMPMAAPRPQMMMRARFKEDMEQDEMAVAAAAAPMEKMRFEEPVMQVETSGAGASVTYRCGHPVTIAGDGSTHRPMIADFDLPARLDHVTVPKLAEEAYLRATITNTSDYVFLPGPASVFHDDEYVSATELKLTARNEEIKLQLGVDARVKVKRELVTRDTSKTFLIGNSRKIELGYRIEVQNLTGRVASVMVEDQVPHSRHEEIKVKPGTLTPKPAEQTDLGILRWNLSIRAQEKAEIRFDFLVEHPRAMELEGLDV